MTAALQAVEAQSYCYRQITHPDGEEAVRRWNSFDHDSVQIGFEDTSRAQMVEMKIHTTRELLRTAIPFYWEPHCMKLVEGAAKKLPDTFALSEQDILCPAGFFYFPTPYASIDFSVEGGPTCIESSQGLGWRLSQGLISIVRFASFTESVDGVDDGVDLFPSCFMVLKITGEKKVTFGEYKDRSVAGTDDLLRQARIDRNKFEISAILFAGQKIVTTETRKVGRAARRRQNLITHEFRIVRLREAHNRSTEKSGGSFTEWACRWAVRGHWRNQYFSGNKSHRTIWIDPYVKGPSDKPFKVSVSVFDVAR